jgi:uncharacterized protein (TIGR03435 family)
MSIGRWQRYRSLPSLIALAFVARAQAPDARLTFDAASVKVASPPFHRVAMIGGPGTKTPDRINFENIGLGSIIAKAYDVKRYQIFGPDWLDSERYNVIATVAPGTTKEQFQLMLQNLLVDRFQLKLHRDTKEMAVYSLAVAKNGPKFKKAVLALAPAVNNAPHEPPDFDKMAKDADGYPVLGPGMTMATAGGYARAGNKAHMEWLVDMIASQTGRPVIDATGLTDEYDFLLSWIPQPPGVNPSVTDDPKGPDLFQALEQQLGLKLESKKAPIIVLVIDRAEKTPTPN